MNVELLQNVRGKDVFVLQPTCVPTNDNLMELVILVDALKRASAGRVTAAIPYFGYARQDRRPRSARVPITAKVVANMLQAAGPAPVDDGSSRGPDPGLLRHRGRQHLRRTGAAGRPRPPEIHRPDGGLAGRWRGGSGTRFAKRLECDLAIIDKRRPKANVSEVMNIIGEVKDRTCVIMDDIVDTAGTLCKAAQALKEQGGAKRVAYCTHPVLSGAAVSRIGDSALDELVVTDTIPLRRRCPGLRPIRQVSVAVTAGRNHAEDQQRGIR